MDILPGKGNRMRHLPSRLMILSSYRYARQHLWQTWLSFTGIMLGVMMVVAIDLANNSASRAFELSLEAVNGTLSHQIVGGSQGVSDEVYIRLKTELGIRRSAPGVSGLISIRGQGFSLVGLDVFSEASLQRQRPGQEMLDNNLGGLLFSSLTQPNAVVMSESVARNLQLETGDAVEVFRSNGPGVESYRTQLVLAATFASEDSVATEGLVLADISVAQDVLHQSGRINSIDLVLNSQEVILIKDWLPAGLTLVDAQSRNDSLEQMNSAFHINLLAMSMLSLLVAGLLIYNTVTLSVIRRQVTLGIFRSQGVSRHEIFYLVLSEAALLGVIASVVGLVFGLGLGQMLVDLVSRAIPDLNYRVNVTSFLIQPWSLLKGFGFGMVITLFSAVLPAWHASHCTPVTLQQRSVNDEHWRSRMPWLTLTGLVMMGFGYMLLQSEYGALVGGFVALTLIVFGFCFLVPGFMTASLKLIFVLASKKMSLPARMALRNVQAGISRTGLAVAALTVALSVTIGVGIMVGSFRGTVILWLDQSFAGDVEISGQGFPEQLLIDLNNLENVARVSGTTQRRVESEFGPVRLEVTELAASQNYYLKQGDEYQLERFDAGEGVLISEPMAYLQQIVVGDSITLMTDTGAEIFPVLGIFFDYTPGLGMVALRKSLYRQWWQNQTVSRLTIRAERDSDTENGQLLPAVRTVLGQYDGTHLALSNRDIRRMTLEVFDRTFTITSVLRLLALLVAFVGVLSALMALLLEKSKEIAILRASGMTATQVTRLILGQTAVLGIFAGVLSLPLGMMMSEVLIDVINKRSFGWSMQHTIPFSVLVQALLLAMVAALLAGVYPAVKSARISPATALREE